jgi:hypothetical protein
MTTPKPMYLLYTLVFFMTVSLGCCAQNIRYRAVGVAKPRPPHIRPEVGIVMDSMDRMEIYAGGLHVGTFVFDGNGAVFVGDGEPAARVIQELLTQLEMLRMYLERDGGDTYY